MGTTLCLLHDIPHHDYCASEFATGYVVRIVNERRSEEGIRPFRRCDCGAVLMESRPLRLPES